MINETTIILDAYKQFLPLHFINPSLNPFSLLLNLTPYLLTILLIIIHLYHVLILFNQFKFLIPYSNKFLSLTLLFLLLKMSLYSPANMTGDHGIRPYVLLFSMRTYLVILQMIRCLEQFSTLASGQPILPLFTNIPLMLNYSPSQTGGHVMASPAIFSPLDYQHQS